jgi:cobalt-zinc-cadmium efflux system outer membrane protein
MLLRFLPIALLLPSLAQSQTVAPLPEAPVTTVLTLPVAASQTSAPTQVLTLDDAIAMAERSNPRLRGAAAATARADAATRTARAYANPSVEIFAGQQYARPIATPGPPGLLQHYAAYQAIEIPSERRARLRIAKLATTSSRFGEAGVLRSVTADVKRAFYDVLRRREEIEHTQENLKLVEDLRRRVEVQVKVGEQGRLELTRAEAELARAGFAVRSAQIELSNAIAILRVAIAAPADAKLEPRGALEPRIQLPSLAELRDQVLRIHPAMAQSQADVQTAQAKLEHDRRLRIPQPTLFAEFENQPDLRFWRTGVTVPIPLWDRRGGQIAEATAAIAQSGAILEQRRLELISVTERAFEQYQLADEQATSLESGELRAAESAVSAAQAAYRFGERGIVEVLDAQRVLQDVRGELVDAQYARQSALSDLEELGAIAPGRRP